MIYGSENAVSIPNLDLLSFLFDFDGCHAGEDTLLHADAADPNLVLTKSEARTLTKQFAHFLRETYGIGKSGPGQDVVTVVSSGQHRLACLFYGIVAAEGVYSPGSTTAAIPELAERIKKYSTKLLVCSKDAQSLCVDAAKEAGLATSNILVLESVPKVRLYSIDGSAECMFEGLLDWRRITSATELEESLICLGHSSGTTGLPKGVRISHLNMVSQCFIPSTMNWPVWETWSPPYESRTLAHLPTTHISGIQGYFVNAFYDGGVVYWMPKFDFGSFVKHNVVLGITTFFTVPSIYNAIAKVDVVTDQFSKLRIANCGGAPLSKELSDAATKKLGGGNTRIVQNWGMTEATGAVTHMCPGRTDGTGSISALMPNILMRLVDTDGNDVGPGEPGEALLKGPVVTRGYYQNSEANASTFTEDGWMRTGDIIRVQVDLLYLIDRKKDIIKSKEPVSPSEVENLLMSHPLVSDAFVVGVFSEELGYALLKGFIVPRPGATDEISNGMIKDFMKDKVSDAKQLKAGIVFVSAVPRGPTGKLERGKVPDAGLVLKA